MINKIMKHPQYIFLMITIIVIISSITIVDGETDTSDVDDIFKINTNVNYAKPCFYNSSFCSASAVCNYTIYYPNDSILVDNQIATNRINNHNYSIFVDTKGIHTADMVCKDNGYFGFATFRFMVTDSGSQLSTSEGIIYIIFIVALIFVFILSLYGAITIPFKNNWNGNGLLVSVNDFKYLKVVCIVFSYLILMGILGITRQISANYLYLNGVYRIVEWMYWFMFSFVWPLMVFSVILMIVMFATGQRLKKALDRGFQIHKGGDIR